MLGHKHLGSRYIRPNISGQVSRGESVYRDWKAVYAPCVIIRPPGRKVSNDASYPLHLGIKRQDS